jgi:hypothetical protein
MTDIDLSPEKPFKALGDLMVSVSGRRRKTFRNGGQPRGPDPRGLELMDQIVHFLTQSLKHEHPLDMVKDWISAERTFKVLIECGYPHRPLMRLTSSALDEFGRLFRAELIKRLLIGKLSEEEAKRGLMALSAQIERGIWKNWSAEWQEVENRICDDISSGRLKTE